MCAHFLVAFSSFAVLGGVQPNCLFNADYLFLYTFAYFDLCQLVCFVVYLLYFTFLFSVVVIII